MNIVTLIPAYKTKYISELFLGLARQTRPTTRIIVSDDSPEGQFAALLNSAAAAPLRAKLPIEIHRGPQNGPYLNFKRLLDLWNGSSELVHLMLDDDVIYPEFYELHVAAHVSRRVSCSVSGRWYSNEAGQPVSGMRVPQEVRLEASRIVSLGPDALFKSTVPHCNNWLGEFSNCVMTRECTGLLRDPRLSGIPYAGLWDVGTFLVASRGAPVAFLQDRLGYFRLGPDHQSANFQHKELKAAHLAWVALALGGHRAGHLSAEDVQMCCKSIEPAVSQRYPHEQDMLPFHGILPQLAAGMAAAEDFLVAWESFLTTMPAG